MLSKKNKILILGSGTSTGIPMINCQCDVCNSKNKKNQRLRTSIYMTTVNQTNVLIDTSTDLRYQSIKNKLSRIDAVLITHSHADHIHGIDDLRQFCFSQEKNKIPIYASSETAIFLKDRFPYIFKKEKIFFNKKPILGGDIPNLSLKILNTKKTKLHQQFIAHNKFKFCLLPHTHTEETLGIIHSKFAYLPDCHDIPPPIVKALRAMKLDLLIIDCLQTKPHRTHLSVDQCFNFIQQIRPAQAGLIHMNHQLDHKYLEKISKKTFSYPVGPCFDGQEFYYS